jgi:hypothetical protein
MSGCIALFKGIDPEVSLIQTYSGSRPDTVYSLDDGEWRAHRPKSTLRETGTYHEQKSGRDGEKNT